MHYSFPCGASSVSADILAEFQAWLATDYVPLAGGWQY